MMFITGTEAMECALVCGVKITQEALPQVGSYFSLDCFRDK